MKWCRFGQHPSQQAGEVVAYLDIGAGGYLDLGSALSDEALQQLPKGRHAMVIAGTYGIDGYVSAPQPSTTAQADSVTAHSGEPVAWKHDCAALLTNDVELWIDACPHCGKPRNAPQPVEREPLTTKDYK